MPSVINDTCIKCGSCAAICPVSAMHLCDSQMVIAECPVSAIANDADADPAAIKFNAEQSKICPNAND